MKIPQLSSRLQYLALLLSLAVVVGGGSVVFADPMLQHQTLYGASDSEERDWTPSNEPIPDQKTDTPREPPNARERMNSTNGTTVVQISPGVALAKGYEYVYTANSTGDGNGSVVLDVRDTSPDGYVILGVEYKFGDRTRTTSDTGDGDTLGDVLEGVGDGNARLAVERALSVPHIDGSHIKPSADVGDSWKTDDGVSVEAVEEDTIGHLDCLVLEFTKDGELLSQICYSPEKQVVTKRVTYENGTEVHRVTLEAVR